MVRMYVMAAVAAAGVAALAAVYATGTAPDPAGTAALEAGGSPPLGDAGAPLTMIEWGDYQCTFCYRFHQNTLDSLMEYVDSGELRIIFQDFPLNGHDSVLAAQAARCAADQGLFWEYHDTLYQNWGGERTGWIRPPVLYGFALNVGLDMRMYGDCVGEGRHLGNIRESYRLFQEAGIDATPSFVIHDGERSVKIVGNQPAETFVRTIEQMLR
ncbi:MAG: thioredoxin domain-containing protein [Nitrosopumilaceae archaeon]|nr:thioredoxin domain-containing protein [Nitrosopumilaceae archaeon]